MCLVRSRGARPARQFNYHQYSVWLPSSHVQPRWALQVDAALGPKSSDTPKCAWGLSNVPGGSAMYWEQEGSFMARHKSVWNQLMMASFMLFSSRLFMRNWTALEIPLLAKSWSPLGLFLFVKCGGWKNEIAMDPEFWWILVLYASNHTHIYL